MKRERVKGRKRLRLSKETVRELNAFPLRAVGAGPTVGTDTTGGTTTLTTGNTASQLNSICATHCVDCLVSNSCYTVCGRICLTRP